MTAPVLSVVDKLPAAVANRETIETLETYLADAKAGIITAVAIAAITSDGKVLTVATHDRFSLLGAMQHLSWRISLGIEDIEEEGGVA